MDLLMELINTGKWRQVYISSETDQLLLAPQSLPTLPVSFFLPHAGVDPQTLEVVYPLQMGVSLYS